MKVKVEYTVYKTMEIEIPKALSEAYHKATEEFDNSFDTDCIYDDINDFVDAYVKAEEGKDNVDSVFDWDEVES